MGLYNGSGELVNGGAANQVETGFDGNDAPTVAIQLPQPAPVDPSGLTGQALIDHLNSRMPHCSTTAA